MTNSDSTKSFTEHSSKKAKESSFSCGGKETTFNTLVLDLGAVESVDYMARVPSVFFGSSNYDVFPVPRLSCTNIRFW